MFTTKAASLFFAIFVTAGASVSAQRTIRVDPVEVVQFGPLENAPNGHISFQKSAAGFRIWVPGRLPTDGGGHEEGGFLFDLRSWDDLSSSVPTFTLGHVVAAAGPDCSSNAFDANYAAMNAVVPSADPTKLLAFYDAEYHAACPEGQPLLASVGLATSTDGGVTWQKQGQVIEGLDEARKGFDFVSSKQRNEFNNSNHILDVGASGPSAVVREDGNLQYIYLYYADRTPITGGDDSIYLARSPLSSGGAPGTWQQWTGASWGAAGDLTSAVPIVAPPAGGSAFQPHVSWNTALRRWLMVFKNGNEFDVSTSIDGVKWDAPTMLLPFDVNDAKTGFPTLITPNSGGCMELNCRDDSGSNRRWQVNSGSKATQQTTGPTGWLFYSSLPSGKTKYVGKRAAFQISN
jgi:hypothetical protein